MKENSSDSDDTPVVITALYMLIFYVIYLVLGYLLFGIGLSQLVIKILSSQPQPDLQRFGKALGRYMSQIVEYVSMRSPVRPYPFSDWPSDSEGEA